MNSGDSQRLAAANNAAWCISIWRSHGLEVRRQHGMVACVGAPPRFYPNAVTVDPKTDPATQRAWLAELAGAADAAVAVKDSFQTLELAAEGYSELFQASWIRRDARLAAGPRRLDWRLVEDAEDLTAWELAWQDGQPSGPRIFLPSLLADRSLGILAGVSSGRIVAGCVLSVTGRVVGLSHVFGDYGDVVRAATAQFDRHDLVGYERSEALEDALACGFEPVGRLTVWSREPQP
ncbi:MAG: hypothetical protein ACHP7N_09130 [Caulobacterales bacterium]